MTHSQKERGTNIVKIVVVVVNMDTEYGYLLFSLMHQAMRITQLPNEVQIYILSYLFKSYELSCIQRTCCFHNSERIHDSVDIVVGTFLIHHNVYGIEFTYEEGVIFPISRNQKKNYVQQLYKSISNIVVRIKVPSSLSSSWNKTPFQLKKNRLSDLAKECHPSLLENFRKKMEYMVNTREDVINAYYSREFERWHQQQQNNLDYSEEVQQQKKQFRYLIWQSKLQDHEEHMFDAIKSVWRCEDDIIGPFRKINFGIDRREYEYR